MRIEVILGHVEAVSVVWVTHILDQGGQGACLEMVDKKSKDVAQSVEENIMKDEILGSENIFLVLDDSNVGTFYKGEEPVQDFEGEEREEKKVQVPKG